MKFDSVIFDIDNVLVDTRASYTDCIRRTVEVYLERYFGFHNSRSALLSRSDIETFKSFGGFNDDWDTCLGLLLYLLSLNPKRHSLNELRKKKKINKLAHEIKTRPLGTRGAERSFGKKAGVSIRRVSEIFQQLYLSEFVWNEKLLIQKPTLKRLRRIGLGLGIVTGRNAQEAQFALRRFQIDSLFGPVVTLDDTPKEMKKPHPFGLLKVAKALGSSMRYLYVGDLPDDMLAAKRAKKKITISACGYLQASNSAKEMKATLKKAGAAHICKNQKELLQLITS